MRLESNMTPRFLAEGLILVANGPRVLVMRVVSLFAELNKIIF